MTISNPEERMPLDQLDRWAIANGGEAWETVRALIAEVRARRVDWRMMQEALEECRWLPVRSGGSIPVNNIAAKALAWLKCKE